jgi:hypothetical protein
MPNIVMDALSHQAIRALGTEATAYGQPSEQGGRWRGIRLSGLEARLVQEGHGFRFAEPTADELAAADILIVASRSQSCPFSPAALADIAAFVQGGGGLLLMANHRNFIQPQQQVATALKLPIAFNDITIANFPPIAAGVHPISVGITSIRVRNTASLGATAPGENVAYFTQDPRHLFAAACEVGSGRVLATGDSGFIASSDDTGVDLFASADNALFVSNAITWLSRT